MTTFLDLLGVGLIAGLTFCVWPPLVLGVLGAAALLASREASRRKALK